MSVSKQRNAQLKLRRRQFGLAPLDMSGFRLTSSSPCDIRLIAVTTGPVRRTCFQLGRVPPKLDARIVRVRPSRIRAFRIQSQLHLEREGQRALRCHAIKGLSCNLPLQGG